MSYFHGGIPRLKVGDRLLPPALTGALSCADVGCPECRPDRVYVTTELNVARVYAALYPAWPGDVYEVVPVGEVAPDADVEGGDSFSCESAVVVRVVEEAVPRAAGRALIEDFIEQVKAAA